MTSDISNRRRHERVEVAQAIFIEEIKKGPGKKTSGEVIRCETVDVSVQGLKIHVPTELKAGSKLNIAVPQDGWVENLELQGEARWVRPATDGNGFWVGLELQDTSRENMEKWFKTVSLLSKQGHQA